MILLSCPGCRGKLRARREAAGKSSSCPRCQELVQVPDPRGPARTAFNPIFAAASQPVHVGETLTAGDSGATLPGRGVSREPYPDFAPAQQLGEIGWLGQYRILRELGMGGIGMVFQAEDCLLTRPVALKVLRPALAADNEYRRRFIREARLTAAIDHDHVVAVHQIGVERGIPFLVMKLLQGETLDDRLARERDLPLTEVLRIGREIAEGLAGVHEQGIIHRDLKPSNIWLEGPRGRVKIIDFGLAYRRTDEDVPDEWLRVIGTPSYMAPEQTRGEPAEVRSDLFSLGCVLYLLCTNRPAFERPSITGTLRAIATAALEPPHRIDPEIPVELSRLVLSLLAKERRDRPATASAVARELLILQSELRRLLG